jgi:hypothetical protein
MADEKKSPTYDEVREGIVNAGNHYIDKDGNKVPITMENVDEFLARLSRTPKRVQKVRCPVCNKKCGNPAGIHLKCAIKTGASP